MSTKKNNLKATTKQVTNTTDDSNKNPKNII